MASKGTVFCTQHSWLRVKENMVKSAKRRKQKKWRFSKHRTDIFKGQVYWPENGQINKRKRSGCFPSTEWISWRASVTTWKWSNQQKKEEEVDVSQAQNGYLEGHVYWPENGQINKKKKWMFPKHRTDSLKGRPENGQISTNKEEEEVDVSQAQNGYFEGHLYWPENGQINKKKKFMFSKHRMDILYQHIWEWSNQYK